MIYCDRPGEVPVLWQFLAEKTHLPWSTDLQVIGRVQGLAPVAAIGYNSWVGTGVFMHIALRSPEDFTRELLREAFRYPFVARDRQVAYALTPITNEVCVHFIRRVGFKEILRTADFVMFEMKREDCRWIDGKEQRTSGT